MSPNDPVSAGSGRVGAAGSKRLRAVKAVLFDFDGTLTLPGHLDFAAIRAAIGCPPGESLLAHIASQADPSARSRAEEILDEFELQAADRSREDPDAAEVVRYCRSRGLRLGIITRNSRRSVERSFAHFSGIGADDFAIVVTRDDPVSVKPEPDGVLFACRRLGIEPDEALLVGDFLYDIEAGARAGTITVFYDSDPARTFERPACDHVIERLGDLPFILRLYAPLPAGKVPNEMLAYFLSREAAPQGSGRLDVPAAEHAAAEAGGESGSGAENREALLIGPSVGEDVAALLPARLPRGLDRGEGLPARGEEVLLLKSDPITFVAEGFGHYLLTVNANDIATAGGTPRWLLATLLVPPGTLGAEIGRLFADLREGCAREGVVLCGGHTELTGAVTRALVCGTMVGTVSEERLVRKRSMRDGDRIILTKGAAIEGTAILAKAHADELRRAGAGEELIERAAALEERMSVQPEARIAASHPGVTAMHDVTEGGVATALRELATACGRRLRVEADRIPVLPESAEVCRLLGLHPLGLIGSGSLLICVDASEAGSLIARLSAAGIPAAAVGEALGAGEGIEALSGGRPWQLPDFAVDELARVGGHGF